ncbi:MAG: hypothetical protein ROZ37_20580 [Aromatoleum sp.]|uniref:hypothetical protein n=1 Tax=Aromatoleum sp. TaxID=2307007 RepID=UPI002895308B|nr:hypothetical protein [Aromatoleum sp.]MDT3672722.1 hypothetical protein [Aromatoleum sp.]
MTLFIGFARPSCRAETPIPQRKFAWAGLGPVGCARWKPVELPATARVDCGGYEERMFFRSEKGEKAE